MRCRRCARHAEASRPDSSAGGTGTDGGVDQPVDELIRERLAEWELERPLAGSVRLDVALEGFVALRYRIDRDVVLPRRGIDQVLPVELERRDAVADHFGGCRRGGDDAAADRLEDLLDIGWLSGDVIVNRSELLGHLA